MLQILPPATAAEAVHLSKRGIVMGDARDEGKLSVFISYSRDDIAFADQLDIALRAFGFSTSLDRHGISGGEDWRRRLGNLIRDADTVVFVLSPSSAGSDICAWEVGEAVRLGKRIIPVLCRPLDGAKPPPQLADLNYIFFYADPKSPDSGFGTGEVSLVNALTTDLTWLREHTRLLQRATEWDVGGRPTNRLLSGADIETAKSWAARRPKAEPAPTALHLDFIRASEGWEAQQSSEVRRQLDERERLVRLAEVAQRDKENATKRMVQRTLIGGSIAVVLAIAAGGLGVWAEINRRQSEQNFAAAVEVIDNLTLGLAGNLKRSADVKSDTILAILQEALKSFESVRQTGGPKPELLKSKVFLLMEYADAYETQGDAERQLGAAREAYELMRSLSISDPGNLKYQRFLYQAEMRLGEALRGAGKLDDAFAHYQQARAVISKLASRLPQYQYDLGIAEERLGFVLDAKDRPAEAINHYRARHDLSKKLTEQESENKFWQRDLGTSRLLNFSLTDSAGRI